LFNVPKFFHHQDLIHIVELNPVLTMLYAVLNVSFVSRDLYDLHEKTPESIESIDAQSFSHKSNLLTIET